MKPVILIGFMGVGKTSLGKKLAKKMGYDFIDTDKWIEQKTGLSIPEIFEQNGEAYFRKLERNCVEEIKVIQNTVISVGGGLPCFGNTMELLKSFGITIYLKLEAKEIARRLAESKIERPLINGLKENELEKYVEKKLLEREKHYSKAKYTLRPDREFIENYLKIVE